MHVILPQPGPNFPKTQFVPVRSIYRIIEQYVDTREDLTVVDAYTTATAYLKEFVAAFEARGGYYRTLLTDQVGRKLLKMVEDDFAHNEAVQPANLTLHPRDKKYPLHLIGQSVDLGFTVKNSGPGYAYETKVTLISDDCVQLSSDEIELGRLAPGLEQPVQVSAAVCEARDKVQLELQLEWKDFDGSLQSRDFSMIVTGQRSDIDWESLAFSDPYSLEPVVSEKELVGRRDVLNRLIATARASSVGSAVIHGQKRVGKTSIARTLQSHLANLGYLVVNLEGGNYVDPDASATVARLGTRVCKELIRAEPRIAHLGLPHFDVALSPLDEFLGDFAMIVPDRRVVIILDEFDELPLDLYLRGPIGNAFFLTLRGITAKPTFGCILVGGEKMTHIMDCQGHQLNKWSVMPVDYFKRDTDWLDYCELVRRPVADTLEYSDGALNALHKATAGNPYFTKLVCQFVFQRAVSRRDCHIGELEIEQAIEVATREIDRNAFQHFWEDGIFQTGETATEKSIRRRRILITLSDVLSKGAPATYRQIEEHRLVSGIPSLQSDLEEFVTRKVLTEDLEQDTYDFKAPLFYKWLKRRGVSDVIATFPDLDAALRERQKEEQQRVRSEEIVEIIGAWNPYRGQITTEDKIRVWLDQFGAAREQRAMFTILQNLRFYSTEFMRSKMAEVHNIVKRNLTRVIDASQRKRSDILVSYLDGPAKSGAYYAQKYADEAQVYVDNVIEKGKLADALRSRSDVSALLFVDDFVGTGQQASAHLQELDALLAPLVAEKGIKVVFAAVVAHMDGWRRLEQTTENLSMRVQLHACEILDETAQCFSARSSMFPDPVQRDFAKNIAYTAGKLLERDCPLGYGGLELAIVFDRGCPNDSLPILWSESPKWMPLFKRQ